MPVEIRPADAADGPFLAEMLVAAAFWRPEGPQGKVSDVMDQPELAHYVVGWPQPGDCGVIAEDEHPVGAAWFRFLPASDPGFGFVDAGVRAAFTQLLEPGTRPTPLQVHEVVRACAAR